MICPSAIRGLARPIVVYVGAMEEWFDFDLVNRAARALPDFSFVMLGDARRARFDARCPTFIAWGTVAHADLPAYLWNADVGIIPFDVKNHPALVNSINPLKLYEYMACGLPVVSVGWEELRHIASPAWLTTTADDFYPSLSARLHAHGDRQRFIDYAAAQDWGARADAIIAALGSVMDHPRLLFVTSAALQRHHRGAASLFPTCSAAGRRTSCSPFTMIAFPSDLMCATIITVLDRQKSAAGLRCPARQVMSSAKAMALR